ncbi:Histidinol-phosphate aminotransferase [hydrothermal vent metagenome]|uniref:Histidinol-phosphate aminotransferase n=1 Tax=hydrothermal vent metagenome TaxID=652676 RepID=A0A3B1CXU0_9ZZZZ
MKIQRLLRKNIKTLKAYSAKEIPCRVKLDANESPYGFPSFLEPLKDIQTNQYPDPEARELRRAVAKRWRLRAGQILTGNGSDELISYLITTFGGPVLFPTPTFSMYGITAQALGEERIAVPLDSAFDLDTEKMLNTIRKYRPKLIFLSSPNNPTGNCFSTGRILKIINASRGIVVIDEAYQPFSSRRGMLKVLKDYENVTIMRTLSKVGFAALRVGLLLGREDLIEAVNRVRLPFNVNTLSQAVAVEAIKNFGEIEKTLRIICSERGRLFDGLLSMEGITPYPSEANFILFKVRNAPAVYRKLLSKGVLVRHMGTALKDCLRVTVGRPEDNGVFLETLSKVIGK